MTLDGRTKKAILELTTVVLHLRGAIIELTDTTQKENASRVLEEVKASIEPLQELINLLKEEDDK